MRPRELGIGVTAYGVLSRGLISGHWSRERQAGKDFRTVASPRFQGDNLEANLALVERMRTLAQDLGVTVAQLAIAWVAAQGLDVVPLVGARRPDRLQEALGAADLMLKPDELARLEAIVPPGAAAGERYNPSQMLHLDSEMG
jgi:pyridoxine 4-dehydrogenase